MPDATLKNKLLTQLNSILQETLADFPVTVYLFGSWARGEEKRSTDIDIAIEPKRAIPSELWVRLQDRIDESTIPYNVDVIDLSIADEPFKQKVKNEGIIWSD